MKMHCRHTTTLTLAAAILLIPIQFTLANDHTNNINKRHIQLVTPRPYAWDEYGPTNPLNPDGSDYPCKVPQGSAFKLSGAPTEIVAGEPQVASFAGQAVHGGGSCQFALTEGFSPDRASRWKVVHSVEGGCPKADAAGNLGEGQVPDNYTFVVPEEGFGPGEYTFAWTWVNRIGGQPEFYMNCAPVIVKAKTRRVKGRGRGMGMGMGKRAGQSTYPDLFLANIGDASNGCETSEALHQQVAIEYPYPGDSVSYPDGTSNLFKQPCDGNPHNNDGSAGSGGGGGGSGAASSSASGTAVVATTSSSSLTKAPAPTSSAASTTSSISSTLDSTSASLPTPMLSPPQSSASVITSPTTTTTTTASTAGPWSTAPSSLGSPCTDGHLLCVNMTQFSTCTGGEWTAPQDLASNARCKEEGESVGLDITNVW